jgi:hypothetical protein
MTGCIAIGLLIAIPKEASALDQSQEKKTTAEQMFSERCKKSGEFIYRTVDDVEGIFLIKIRSGPINYGETKEHQFRLDDPYGRDFNGEAYITSFLIGRYQAITSGGIPGLPPRNGYLYVEAIDQEDGQRYHYTGFLEEPWQTDKHFLKGYIRFSTKKVVAAGDAPRYGVTFDDISTREEREHWIAGSSLKVIDMKTNEIVAERIGYMMDRAQGSRKRGHKPWLFAPENACPTFLRVFGIQRAGNANLQTYQTLDFVEKVLKPRITKEK